MLLPYIDPTNQPNQLKTEIDCHIYIIGAYIPCGHLPLSPHKRISSVYLHIDDKMQRIRNLCTPIPVPRLRSKINGHVVYFY